MGAYASCVVFRPVPWWDPRVVVPTTGMILGNSISGPSVALDRLLAEISDRTHETETRLALGATSFESIRPAVKIVMQTALRPLLNMLSIVGLVSIPGESKLMINFYPFIQFHFLMGTHDLHARYDGRATPWRESSASRS